MRYWKKINKQGITTTVEEYSHSLPIEGAIEISKGEFEAFIASLPKPSPLPNYKELWKVAVTPDDKLKVLENILGLGA